jgi:phosphatidylserine/phosphatidylglycerophosphate/cardiolipin synthase-like enzyme
VAPEVEIEVVDGVEVGRLAERIAAAGIELVVLAPPALPWVAAVAEVRRRRPLYVLWAPSGAPAERPLREILCVASSSRSRDSMVAFLREHATPALHCRLVVPPSGAPADLAAALAAEGIDAAAELASGAETLRDLWRRDGPRQPPDLIVLAHWPGALLAMAPPPTPLLVLPPALPPDRRPEPALDMPDLLVVDGFARARLRHALGVGRREPIRDQTVEVLAGGAVVAMLDTAGGVLELDAALCGESVGVRRAGGTAAAEVHVRVLRPADRPLVLADASLPPEDLPALAARSAAVDLLAVRLLPLRGCRAIRARWRAAGLPALVADASAVLDEGEALDVSPATDAVRLARVASRLRADGYPVVAIVYTGPHRPRTSGFEALRPAEMAAREWTASPPPAPARTLADRLSAIAGATATHGNRVEVELDNPTARRWLLEALARARERVLFQVYMAAGDDVGTAVELALAATAARGVAVRVLVDSLHALHGSLGARNPLLDRLAARPGVELRLSRPVTTLPSLEDLKQRIHRKLAIVDGEVALAGGRNLSHEYYTGFGEVALTPGSAWREVPWLDAGARVEGPAVADLEAVFREAWLEAGGAGFPIGTRPPAGPSPVRVVTHDGLRDAATLEAFLALIDTARSHVYAINGFPLLLEIQHALLRALRRGVRVRTLFGHLTPTHGGKPFGGPWSTARTAATELVHSRMDALVEAGAEAYRLAVPEQPGWEPGLGIVRPHVHAKVLTADGEACAVGSANLDVTAGYWESEVLLVVEDPAVTRAVEARASQLMAGSDRVDRDDPDWRAAALRRRWMHRWPGVLSV